MKQFSIFFMLTVFLYGCAPAATSAPIETAMLNNPPTASPSPSVVAPTVTPIPCPADGTPIVFGDIKIFFDNGVPQTDCDLFSTYLGKYNSWMEENGYWTGSLEVYVFSDSDRVTDFEYDLCKSRGCNPDSKDNIRALWERPGVQAQSCYGAVFYQVFSGNWQTADLNEKVAGIFGETVLATARNYTATCPQLWKIPDWVAEGFGVYMARFLEAQWGIEPAEIGPDNLQGCQAPLAQLKAGERCVYVEGAQAFALLAHDYPDVKPFDLWEWIQEGKSFNEAFYETYAISVSQFYEHFDDFRTRGYPFPVTPSPTAPPVGISVRGEFSAETLAVIEDTANQAYDFYSDLGCSSDKIQVTIDAEDISKVAVGTIAINPAIAGENPSLLSKAVSYQMAHAMCQLALTLKDNTSLIDYGWLYEGVASYFSTLERLTNAGMNSDWQGSIKDQEAGLLEQVACSSTDDPISLFSMLEGDISIDTNADLLAFGDVAARLLIKNSGDDIKTVINYYTLLASTPSYPAFKQAFGMTKEEFYQIYEDECKAGFPTIMSNPSQ